MSCKNEPPQMPVLLACILTILAVVVWLGLVGLLLYAAWLTVDTTKVSLALVPALHIGGVYI